MIRKEWKLQNKNRMHRIEELNNLSMRSTSQFILFSRCLFLSPPPLELLLLYSQYHYSLFTIGFVWSGSPICDGLLAIFFISSPFLPMYRILSELSYSLTCAYSIQTDQKRDQPPVHRAHHRQVNSINSRVEQGFQYNQQPQSALSFLELCAL